MPSYIVGRSEEERFLAFVGKELTGSGCLLWTGTLFGSGYGAFRRSVERGGKNQGAHRVAMEMHLGRALLESELCLHRCDVRRCVNPEHLFLGTHQDNATDKAIKGRGRTGKMPYGVTVIDGNTIISKVRFHGVLHYLGTSLSIEEAHRKEVDFKQAMLEGKCPA